MPITYTDTDDLSNSSGVKFLVYGRAKVGKTLLAATAPNPIIGAIEPGLLCLTKANQMRVYGTHVNVPVAPIDSYEALMEFYGDVTSPGFPYKTVILDSISELGEKVLNQLLKTAGDPRQAYGEMQSKLTDALKLFRDIKGIHVVFMAKSTPNREGCLPYHIPMMPGKGLGPGLPYLMDEVLHLSIGETPEKVKYRYFQTQPDINFEAGDRSGALDFMEAPDLSVIINKILANS